jgi:hypothetical protein
MNKDFPFVLSVYICLNIPFVVKYEIKIGISVGEVPQSPPIGTDKQCRKRITVCANLSRTTLLIRISKLIKVMLHLHIFLKIKSLYDFYSLLIFLKTCEHLLIGNPFYLSN